MKKFLCALLGALTAFSAFGIVGCGSNSSSQGDSSSESTTIQLPADDAVTSSKVMTVNIAYPATFEKSYIKYKGQTPDDYTMKKRFNRLCALVDYFSPDVMMLQEVNGKGGWWDYLVDGEDTFLKRNTKYDFVGTTNLAGGTNGSGGARTLYNQIYYKTSKFELVDGGTFFCRDDKTSPENYYTGDYEGVYDANNTTTCTYAVLKDKTTSLMAVYATTHLCTRADASRCFRSYGQARNLTEGLYDIAEEYKWGEEALPIIVGGDFNGPESDKNFYSYPHMTDEAHYTDSQKAAPELDNSGTARIFGASIANNGNRIDYIFNQGAEVTDYKVLSGTFIEDKAQTTCEYNPEAVLDGSEYDLTDHLPVFAKLKINAESKSVAPDTYVNSCINDDTVITEESEINATATKIVFDSTKLLAFVGRKLQKGFKADIVIDGSGKPCLRLTMEKSRIDPCISIDYASLMSSLGLQSVMAQSYKKIKIEYKYCATKDVSLMNFGASTIPVGTLTIGVNTQILPQSGTWNTQILDYSGVDEVFWEDEFTYFGFATGVGLMAGDSIYIRSIELIS